MSSFVPTTSTPATAVPVVSGAAIAATDDARSRWIAALRRIAAAISAAHTARVPF